MLSRDLVKDMPMFFTVLTNLGNAGFVIAMGMNANGSINYIRGALALVAIGLISYANTRLVKSITHDEIKNTRLNHILSFLVLVMAIGYSC